MAIDYKLENEIMEECEKSIYLFYAGDSTAAQKTFDAYPEIGLGQALPVYLKQNVIVHNHAINGRSTKSFIDQGRLAKIDSEIREGDFLFIQFAHNDEKSEDPLRYADAFGAYKDNLKKFVAVARAHKATPVILSAIERRSFKEGELLNTHGDYIEAARQVAEEENVPYIDMNALSRKAIIELGDEDSKKICMNFGPGEYANYPEGKNDNTHLREYGALLYTRLMAEAMLTLGEPLAGLVNPKLKEK